MATKRKGKRVNKAAKSRKKMPRKMLSNKRKSLKNKTSRRKHMNRKAGMDPESSENLFSGLSRRAFQFAQDNQDLFLEQVRKRKAELKEIRLRQLEARNKALESQIKQLEAQEATEAAKTLIELSKQK